MCPKGISAVNNFDPNNFQSFAQYRQLLQGPRAGLGCWVAIAGVILLGSVVGFQFLVNSLAIFLLLLFVSPFVLVLGLQWYVKRQVVTAPCPRCDHGFTAMGKTQFQCPSCGETLEVHNRQFIRVQTPGTIDVDVVEVRGDLLNGDRADG